MPTPEELNAKRKNIPLTDAVLKGQRAVKVAEKVFNAVIDEKKGPLKKIMAGQLKEGWGREAEKSPAPSRERPEGRILYHFGPEGDRTSN